MEIFLLFVSLATTILVLTGNTYVSAKKKWYKRPTKLGWVTIFLTLILFGANLFTAVRNKREESAHERTRKEINNKALNELLDLINSIERENKYMLLGKGQKTSDLLPYLVENDSFNYRERIDSLDLLGDSGFFPKATWVEVISRNADGTRQTLDKVWSKYGEFLDPKIGLQVVALSNHRHLSWASGLQAFLVKSDGGKPTPEEIGLASQIFKNTCYSHELFLDFLIAVNELRNSIDETRNQQVSGYSYEKRITPDEELSFVVLAMIK
jgi:hypothetical protein